MSDEYISKQAVLNLPQSIERNLRGEIVERSIDVKDVEALKPADVAPVVHAKWEHVKHKSIEHGEVVIDGDTVRCSACRHAEKEWHAGMNFCPNCGAKMDGEE